MVQPINHGEIADYYAEKDKRIIVFHTSNNGVSSARNKGIEESTGEYISFVDGDDYLDSDAYEKCIDIMHKEGINVLRYCLINEEKDKSYPQIANHGESRIVNKAEISDLFIEYKLIGSACCFIAKKGVIGDLRFRTDRHLRRRFVV